MTLPLQLPKSRADIAQIQSERKRMAFERAKTMPWYRGKLDHIDANALDDPSEWEKIPILDKETSAQARLTPSSWRQFCAVPQLRDRGILALRRLDRQAGVLSAHAR